MIQYIFRKFENKSAKTNAYRRQIVQNGYVDRKRIIDDIVMATTLTEADISALLTSLEDVLKGHLSQGRSVRLGYLGSFHPTLKVKSAESLDECMKQPIERIHCVYFPSTYLRRYLSKDFVKFREYKYPAESEVLMTRDDMTRDEEPMAQV